MALNLCVAANVDESRRRLHPGRIIARPAATTCADSQSTANARANFVPRRTTTSPALLGACGGSNTLHGLNASQRECVGN